MIRFQGYVTEDGFYVLDTATGAVKLVKPSGAAEICTAWATHISVAPQISTHTESNLRPPQSPVEPAYNLDPLDMMVISSFPYPIATTYKSFLYEPDPRLRCKLLVDTFTNVIKMWALQISSEYLTAKDVKDTAVNQTLSRDFQRPLISAWNLMLHRCIPVLQEADVEFFSPELPRCYERLESRCKDKFSVKKRYEDKEGNSKFKISKLGKIQAMIKYRNSLAHGYNQSTQQAEKDLSIYVPLLKEILDAAKFMTSTPLCMIQKEDGAYKTVRLMGLTPAPEDMDIPALDLDPDTSPVFLYNPSTRRVLPLFSFFDVEQTETDGIGLNQDVFLFEGRTKKSVIYLSTQGEHLEKQSKYHYWVELLSKKALEVKLINPDKLDLEMLHAACTRINNRTLTKFQTSGRFIPKVSHFRTDFHSLMQQFVAGEFQLFLLTGDNGVGKTNYLSQLVKRSQNISLYYSANEFRNTDLGSKILRDMGFRSMYLEDFLANSNEHFTKAERKFFLVIDALGSFNGALPELIVAINQLIEQTEDYPWFRIVVSIRSAAYERCSTKIQSRSSQALFTMEDPLKPGERTHEIRMLDFPASMVSECYDKYRNYRYVDPEDEEDPGVYVYRPRTPFSDLDSNGSTVELLRQPLIMKLIMSTFHRRELPSTLTDDEIMQIFMEQVVVESQNPGQGYPNRKRFLVALARQLFSLESESVKVESLYDIPVLEKEIRNRNADSAYVQLIDMGLIQEGWHEEEAFVSFAMDELLSYLLAQILEPKISSADDVLQWSEKAQHFTPIIDAVRIVLQRTIRDGREHLYLDTLDLIDVTEGQMEPSSLLIMQQCVRVMYNLCINNDPNLNKLLERLEANPSWGDLLLIQQLIELCLVNGVLDYMDILLETAEREGTALGGDAEIVALRLQLKSFFKMGKYKIASDLFASRMNLGIGRDDALWADILYFAIRVNKSIGRIDTAIDLYERVIGFDTLTVLLRSELMWQMGLIHFEQDRPEVAEMLLLQAVEVTERHDLIECHMKLLNALARIQIATRRVETGIETLRTVIQITKKLGDTVTELSAQNSLAVTLRSIGQFDQAIEGLFNSLGIAEQLGRKVSQAIAYTNIGVLFWMLNDERAASHQQRSLQIFQENSFIRGIGYCLYRMMIMSHGDSKTVNTLSAELEQLSESLSYSKLPIWLSGSQLLCSLEDGDSEVIWNQVQSLKETRSAVNLENIHVEDGPVFPWLYAAQYMQRQGHLTRLSETLSMIDTELNGRHFHKREELERLREYIL